MRQSAKEKIVVLAVSFALFVGGALSMDRGAGRTVVLACVVLALLAVAVRQTVLKNGKKK
mgnify:CR=1 FL=1